MPLFQGLPDPARLADLHARLPANFRPPMGRADGLLRGDGALGVDAHRVYAAAPDSHPVKGGAPESQASSDGRFGDMSEKLATG